MALTETRPETDGGVAVAPERPAPTQLERLIGTGDHLSNGRVLVGFALFFLAVSAAGLAIAGLDRITADGALGGVSDVLWPSSLVGLVLMGVMPLLLGLAVVVVPLQLGSPSIAFPRAVALGLWTWLIGALLFITSVALDGGIGGEDADAARFGNLALGVMMAALALLAVCVATTVFSQRPVGMGLARVPFFSWSMLVAAPIWIMTMGATAAHVFVGHISRADAAGLAENFVTGSGWFLRAPAVHMLAIPVLGIAADAVGHATGRRLAPYGALQGAIAAFGVLSFGAWAQTAASVETIVWIAFSVLAALPALALLGGLADALRRGRVPALASMVGGLLAVLLVLGSVLSAAVQALDSAGSDTLWSLNTAFLGDAQTLFVVAAATLGGLAGMFLWSERMFGATPAEGAAKGAATAVLAGGAVLGTILLIQGIAAGDGREGIPEGLLNGIVAAGALLLVLGALAGLAASLGAARTGYDVEPSDAEPGTGGTLEWSAVGLARAERDATDVVVSSPYPLSDLRDGGAADEENS